MTDPREGGVTAPSPVQAALRGQCPRCGGRTLFVGPVAFAPRCTACGLDFGMFNVGDGPAAFLTLILGTIIVGLAVWLQIAFDPPLWVQMVVWIPVALALTILALRIAKAALIGAEYRNAAREGRITDIAP
jgi:uncharacterized protein (DUF983 family)